jgi:S1-C subfamily serine protease
MIGINTMIYSPSGGSVGIGFAIPVNTAKRVVAELIDHGRVRRGWIDASVVQLFPNLVQYAKLPVSAGLLVSRTRRGGFAEQAGLRQGSEPVRYGSTVIYLGGDIITGVDGMKVSTLTDLYSALEDNKPGEKIAVEVIRNEKTVKLEVSLADREEVLNQ